MFHSPLRLAAIVLIGLPGAPAQPCASPPLVITKAALAGGRGIEADREIVIENGRVVRSGRSGALRRPAGAVIIDAAGDTLLPGLIDAHAHLYELGGPSPREMYTEPKVNSFPITGRQLLRSGVTTARVHLFDKVHGPALKRDAASDCYPAPRLQIGGPGMAAGSPEMNGAFFTGFRDLTDARTKLREMREAGADWVALHSLDRFGPGELEAIVKAARAAGLRIMAQGDPAAQAALAASAGADSIEYLDRSNEGYSAALIQQIRRSGAYVVAPVGYYNRSVRKPAPNERFFEFMPPAVREGALARTLAWAAKPDPLESTIDRLNERFLQLTRAGVKMAVGTDCGSPGNFQADAIWWELQTRRQLGVEALDAVRSATVDGAGLLRVPDIGHLRPGARGDFVLYRGDIRSGRLDVDRVRAVGKGGILFVDEGKWTGR